MWESRGLCEISKLLWKSLAGKIWRVGLMGASSTPCLLLLFLGALEHILRGMGHKAPGGAATAAMDALSDAVATP